MAELKTRNNEGDVKVYLNSVEHDKRREDSFVVLELMKEVTGAGCEIGRTRCQN